MKNILALDVHCHSDKSMLLILILSLINPISLCDVPGSHGSDSKIMVFWDVTPCSQEEIIFMIHFNNISL
jgi:hypothetical protein